MSLSNSLKKAILKIKAAPTPEKREEAVHLMKQVVQFIEDNALLWEKHGGADEEDGINAKDKNGVTAMMVAAECGLNDEEILFLFKQGAKFDLKDNQGKTALHKAIQNGHFKTVKILCDLAADKQQSESKDQTAQKKFIEMVDKTGCPALFYAAERAQAETVEYLLSLGADPHVIARHTYSADLTPIVAHMASYRSGPPIDEKQYKTTLGVLRKAGVDFDAPAKEEKSKTSNTAYSPLCYASSTGNVALINALLEQKADVNARGPQGISALEYAVGIDCATDAASTTWEARRKNPFTDISLSEEVRLKTVQALCQAVPLPDEMSLTAALLVAIANRFLNIAKLLIKAGANLNLRVKESHRNDPHTALKLAIKYDQDRKTSEFVDLLLRTETASAKNAISKETFTDSLFYAMGCFSGCVKSLFAANPNLVDMMHQQSGKTLLESAADKHNRHEILASLLETKLESKQNNPPQVALDNVLFKIVTVDANYNHSLEEVEACCKSMRLLIERGADVTALRSTNYSDDSNRTRGYKNQTILLWLLEQDRTLASAQDETLAAYKKDGLSLTAFKPYPLLRALLAIPAIQKNAAVVTALNATGETAILRLLGEFGIRSKEQIAPSSVQTSSAQTSKQKEAVVGNPGGVKMHNSPLSQPSASAPGNKEVQTNRAPQASSANPAPKKVLTVPRVAL